MKIYKPRTVHHNGVPVIEGWPQKIKAAQSEIYLLIGGQKYARIPLGLDGCEAPDGVCFDCAILKGQLHVPGCDMERCPQCEGQLISCACSNKEFSADET